MAARSSRGGAIGPRPMAPPLKVRAAPLEVQWRRLSRSAVWHPSRSQGTNFETKIVRFRWFLGNSDQSELYHTPLLSIIWDLGDDTLKENYFHPPLPLASRPFKIGECFCILKYEILQKTAFSLVKSRLALGSPGCSFVWLSPCRKLPNTQENGWWLAHSDHIHSWNPFLDQERGIIGPASLLHSWHWVLSPQKTLLKHLSKFLPTVFSNFS